jgi:acyl dehydratase
MSSPTSSLHSSHRDLAPPRGVRAESDATAKRGERATRGRVIPGQDVLQLGSGVLVDTIWFDDVEVGYAEESQSVPVDRSEMIAYAARNDPFPIHVDAEAAAQTPFGDVIASFGYVVSLLFRCNHKLRFTQAVQPSFLGALEWRVQFRKAVLGGDRLLDRCTILSKRLASKGDRGVVTSQHELINQDGEPVVVIEVVALHARRPISA